MKHRILSLVLALFLLLTILPAARAAGHGYTDIVGHWGEENILWAMEQGLFNGTSNTTFEPDGSMTRGMFVTVLGRYAGVDPAAYQDWYLSCLYTDLRCTMYYAPYINWAARHGITNGSGCGVFCPEDSITREQMAVFMVRFADTSGYTFRTIPQEEMVTFSDSGSISGYARQAVEVMRTSGVLKGSLAEDGTFHFDPQALATRAECATVFRRLMDTLVETENYAPIYAQEVHVSDHEIAAYPGAVVHLTGALEPTNTSNGTILWVSSDPQVASVDTSGNVTCNRSGEAQVYAYSSNGCYDSCSITVDTYIGSWEDDYETKCIALFGKWVDDPRHPYGDDAVRADYEANIVDVTVQVWDFKKGSTTEKVTKTKTVQVHKHLAPTVQALFVELYACEEQYPIHSIGGYRWSTKSEHAPGLALDINANENAYFDAEGNLLVGKYFDPENDPYSFEVGGEVEQIFSKYGFTRGIYWRNGYKDYMHFSFFGT